MEYPEDVRVQRYRGGRGVPRVPTEARYDLNDLNMTRFDEI